jgi:hypothetical protein
MVLASTNRYHWYTCTYSCHIVRAHVRTYVRTYTCTMVTLSQKQLGVGVVCPGTQRYVDQGSGTTPGLAAETYAAVKAAKYADQDNFIPFILRQVVVSTKLCLLC